MVAGWIKLHRSMLDWEWYGDQNTMRLFIHLLFKANYEDKRWRGVEIKRGQMITSLSNLAEEVGLSVRTTRTCLDRLRSTGELTSKTTNRFTLLTIENYSDYQDIDNETTSGKTIKRQSNDNQTTTTKEVKNLKKEKKKEESVVLLPDWINQELWDGFMAERKKLKASNSAAAVKALINKLTKFREMGLDPNEAISNSIESSWKGVFEPKQKQGGNGKFNLSEALQNDMQRLNERDMDNGPVCEAQGYLPGQVG